ncbi:hypothetical protein [Tenacibaculum sp. UWU-22]|uniref:hypothetical protein n=1 Tax=Tenacibaculum sp. UWU-22 TaxID=3234187 RepID=UPI0034DB2750
MKELIKKKWDYTLYDNQKSLVLKVLCGTVAVYDISIELNPLEVEYYKNSGEGFIDKLAKEIQSNPSKFLDRNIANFSPEKKEKITYSIISRGELTISYNDRSENISGELIFNPPTFYADIISLEKSKVFSEKEKKQIIEFISKDAPESIGTKIIFD